MISLRVKGLYKCLFFSHPVLARVNRAYEDVRTPVGSSHKSASSGLAASLSGLRNCKGPHV